MEYAVDEIMKYIEEEDAKFIRLAFRDAYGVQKNISVMPGEIRKAFDSGIPINPRRIAGFRDYPYASLFLKPDPSTLSVLPWRPDSGKVLRMYCDLYTPDGERVEADTRAILKKAAEKAAEAGISFRFGSEMEFYLFSKDENGNPTRIPYDCAGYMDIAPDDRTLLLLPGADRWAEPEHAAAIGKAGDLLSCGGIVCAICGATVALAHAGMLNDRPHTSNGRGFLETFCPNYTGQNLYVDEPAVADGNMITAAATGALPFARKIIEKLGVFSTETLKAWYAYFSSGRPEHFFALMQSVQ